MKFTTALFAALLIAVNVADGLRIKEEQKMMKKEDAEEETSEESNTAGGDQVGVEARGEPEEQPTGTVVDESATIDWATNVLENEEGAGAAAPVCNPDNGPERMVSIDLGDGNVRVQGCPSAGCMAPPSACIEKTEFVEDSGSCCKKTCNFVLESDPSKPCKLEESQCDKDSGPHFGNILGMACGCVPPMETKTTWMYVDSGYGECFLSCSCSQPVLQIYKAPPEPCDPESGPQMGTCAQASCMGPIDDSCEYKTEYTQESGDENCCPKLCNSVKKSDGSKCEITSDECDSEAGPSFNCNIGFFSEFCDLRACEIKPAEFSFDSSYGVQSCCQGSPKCVCSYEKLEAVKIGKVEVLPVGVKNDKKIATASVDGQGETITPILVNQ